MESGFDRSDPESARQIITVSALNRAVAGLLSRGFALVRVRGEVANFTRAASGHWYFTLKDSAAQVRCVMFRNRNAVAGLTPREGDEVEVLAQVGLYEARGDYQLTVEALRRSGLGQLFERFVQLKNRLAAEGLFDEARKRPLPRLPLAIGIVTSLQAAALRDVLSALARRAPHIALVVYPVPVQGEGAGEKIAAMLDRVSRRAEVDLVLLVRGGGSIEDLWAFNEEVVARALRRCAVPVVVGVGHESDFTIADFAADLRAPTPTAAAELAAPDRAALLGRLDERIGALRRRVAAGLQAAQQRVDFAARSLAAPLAPLRAHQGRVRELRVRLAAAAAGRIGRYRGALSALAQARLRRRPATGDAGFRLQKLTYTLAGAMQRCAGGRLARLQALLQALGHLDPQAVLERGFSIVRDPRGDVVRRARQIEARALLEITFARGAATARVEQIRES